MLKWLAGMWTINEGWKVRALVAEARMGELTTRLEWLEERHELDRDEREKMLKQLVDFETVDAKGRSVFGEEQERARVKELTKRMGESGGEGKKENNPEQLGGEVPGAKWSNLPKKGVRQQRTRVDDLMGTLQEKRGEAEVEWKADADALKERMDKLVKDRDEDRKTEWAEADAKRKAAG